MEAPRLGHPAEPGQEAVSRSAHGARGTSMLGLQATAPLPALPANRRGETTTTIRFSSCLRTSIGPAAPPPGPTRGHRQRLLCPLRGGFSQETHLSMKGRGQRWPCLRLSPSGQSRPHCHARRPLRQGPRAASRPLPPAPCWEGPTHPTPRLRAPWRALWSPPGMKGRPASQQKPVRHRRPRFKPLNFGVFIARQQATDIASSPCAGPTGDSLSSLGSAVREARGPTQRALPPPSKALAIDASGRRALHVGSRALTSGQRIGGRDRRRRALLSGGRQSTRDGADTGLVLPPRRPPVPNPGAEQSTPPNEGTKAARGKPRRSSIMGRAPTRTPGRGCAR